MKGADRSGVVPKAADQARADRVVEVGKAVRVDKVVVRAKIAVKAAKFTMASLHL